MNKNSKEKSIRPIAIIGGNSILSLPGFEIENRRVERTPYGEASAPLLFGKLGKHPVVYLARHGLGSNLEQENMNDLANIYALSTTNASVIIGISSAVSLSDKVATGEIIIPNQLINIGNTKISRFPKPENVPYRPLQFADPYNEYWRVALIKSAKKIGSGKKINIGGTYILTSGLRSETRAEAAFYRQIGGSALGGTGAQEAALARDIDMPYVAILSVVRQSIDLDDNLKPNTMVNEIAQQISSLISNI